MPADQNLGLCHFDDNVAVRLMPQTIQTTDEAATGAVEHTPVCRRCFDRFAAQHLGGAR